MRGVDSAANWCGTGWRVEEVEAGEKRMRKRERVDSFAKFTKVSFANQRRLAVAVGPC